MLKYIFVMFLYSLLLSEKFLVNQPTAGFPAVRENLEKRLFLEKVRKIQGKSEKMDESQGKVR